MTSQVDSLEGDEVKYVPSEESVDNVTEISSNSSTTEIVPSISGNHEHDLSVKSSHSDQRSQTSQQQMDIRNWMLQNQIAVLVEQVKATKEQFQNDVTKLKNQIDVQDERHEKLLEGTVATWKIRYDDVNTKVEKLVDELYTNPRESQVGKTFRSMANEASKQTRQILESKVKELETTIQQQANEIQSLQVSQVEMKFDMTEKVNALQSQVETCLKQLENQSLVIKFMKDSLEETQKKHADEIHELKSTGELRTAQLDKVVRDHTDHVNSYLEAKAELEQANEASHNVREENKQLNEKLHTLQKEWNTTLLQYKDDIESKMTILTKELNDLTGQKEWFENEKILRKTSNDKMGKVVVDLVSQFEAVQDQVMKYVDSMMETNDLVRMEQMDRQKSQQHIRKELNDIFYRMNHIEMLVDNYEDDVRWIKYEIKGQQQAGIRNWSPRMIVGGTPTLSLPSPSSRFGPKNFKSSFENSVDPILEVHDRRTPTATIKHKTDDEENHRGYGKSEEIKALGMENSKLERLACMVQLQSDEQPRIKEPATLRHHNMDIEDLMTNVLQMRLRAVDNIKARVKEQGHLIKVTKADLSERDADESAGDEGSSIPGHDDVFKVEYNNDSIEFENQMKQWKQLYDENYKEVSLLVDELKSSREEIEDFSSDVIQSEFEQQLQLWLARAETLELNLLHQAEEVKQVKNQLLNSKASCNEVRQLDVDNIMSRRLELDLLLEQTCTQGSKVDRILLQLTDLDTIQDDPAIFKTFESVKHDIDELDVQIRKMMQELVQMREMRNGIYSSEERKIEKQIARLESFEEKLNIQTYEITQVFMEHSKVQSDLATNKSVHQSDDRDGIHDEADESFDSDDSYVTSSGSEVDVHSNTKTQHLKALSPGSKHNFPPDPEHEGYGYNKKESFLDDERNDYSSRHDVPYSSASCDDGFEQREY